MLEQRGFENGVTVCDTGRGPRACDVTLKSFIHMKPKIESDVYLSVVMDIF